MAIEEGWYFREKGNEMFPNLVYVTPHTDPYVGAGFCKATFFRGTPDHPIDSTIWEDKHLDDYQKVGDVHKLIQSKFDQGLALLTQSNSFSNQVRAIGEARKQEDLRKKPDSEQPLPDFSEETLYGPDNPNMLEGRPLHLRIQTPDDHIIRPDGKRFDAP